MNVLLVLRCSVQTRIFINTSEFTLERSRLAVQSVGKVLSKVRLLLNTREFTLGKNHMDVQFVIKIHREAATYLTYEQTPRW